VLKGEFVGADLVASGHGGDLPAELRALDDLDWRLWECILRSARSLTTGKRRAVCRAHLWRRWRRVSHKLRGSNKKSLVVRVGYLPSESAIARFLASRASAAAAPAAADAAPSRPCQTALASPGDLADSIMMACGRRFPPRDACSRLTVSGTVDALRRALPCGAHVGPSARTRACRPAASASSGLRLCTLAISKSLVSVRF
jgi:hypothetical protein